MTTASLKVATAQFQLRPERSLEQFLGHMEELVARAAARCAALVLFPELASTGLLASLTDHEVTTDTITADYWKGRPAFTDDIVAGMKQMAAKYEIVVAGG